MKYTDNFFTFPVRLYDIISMQETALQEEAHYNETKEITNKPVNFLIGEKNLRPDDIKSFGDYYGNEVDFDQATANGFNFCLVETYQQDTYECNLTSKEFKDALNAHIEKFPASIALTEKEKE